MKPSYRVLLVEHNAGDYPLPAVLSDIAGADFEVRRVDCHRAARQCLLHEEFEVCLLDSRSGASPRVEIVRELAAVGPPLILLLRDQECDVDVAAIQAGAADCLPESEISARRLEGSIRCAIARGRGASSLREAQNLAQATLDALPDHLAVLDERGVIVFVNAAWRGRGADGEFLGAGSGVGADYLEVCARSLVLEARAGAEGIRAVMSGETESFCCEYPFQNSRGTGWFGLCARRFAGQGPGRVVIAHADISHSKSAEVRLRQSEAALARAQQIAKLGSWELDLGELSGGQKRDFGGEPLRWSDEVFRIFGLAPGEIEASYPNFLRAVHPGDLEAVLAAVDQAIHGGKNYNIEHRIVLPDGSGRTVHEHAEIVRDEADRPWKMVGTVQDISAQKQTEATLHQREEFQRTLLENFPNGSVNVFDRDLRYVLAAGRSLEQNGINPQHLIGKTLHEVYSPEQVALAEANYRRVLEHQTVEFELDFGERTYNICAAPLHGQGGEVTNIIAVAQDISQRKRDEEQLHFQKTLLEAQSEASPDGILVVSGERRVLSFNGRFLEMWGVSNLSAQGEDAAVLQQILGRVADPQQFLERVNSLYEHCDEQSHDELLLRDGRVFELYSAPITSAEGFYYGRVWYFHDITARKAALQAAARLAAIVESSNDAILGKTLDGLITSWNGGAQTLFGYTASEAIGRSVALLIAPDHLQEEIRLLERISQGQRVADYETVRIAKDGRLIDVSLTLSPLKDETGAVVGASAIARDISDRKRAESALRESEARFQSIVASVPGMVYQFTIAPDGRLDWPFVSQGCRDIFEVEPETLRRNPALTLTLEMIHADDRPGFEASVAESARTLSPWNWEGRCRLASGKTKWIQGVSRPQRLPDGSTLWNGLVMDITARREAETERDQFFTMSPDMLGIAGLDGYFKRLNPAFSETLGYSETELRAVPFLGFVHPEDQAATLEVMAALEKNQDVSKFENRYRTKSGAWRWLEWKAVVVIEEGVIYAAARDVSDRKESEAALFRLRDELETRVEERTAELERSNATLQAQYLEGARVEREVRAQARQHEAIADLGRRALLDIDLDTLFQGVASLVSATLDVELCSFWERVPGGDALRWRAGVGIEAGREAPAEYLKVIGDKSHVGHAALVNRPVVSQNLETETRFGLTPLLESKGILSAIAVPVHDDVLYGVISACSSEEDRFGKNEVFFLQTVANVLSSAIARQQTEAEIHALNLDLQGANAELRANEARLLQGNQISTDLMRLRVKTRDELDEALRQITEAASLMLDVERSSVWLFNDNSTKMRCSDLFERTERRHSSGFEVWEDQATFELIKQQRIIAVNEVRTDPTLSAHWKQHFEPLGITAVLQVALVVGGKHIGVLCASHVGSARQWQAEDRTFASAVASVCSLVLESYERSRAESALQEAKEEAERATAEANAANAAKSEFLSRMSHELRTPLNAILGFGQILEMRSSEPKQLGNIQQILKAGRHLLGLINEVLDIARIEAGHLSLSLEPIAAGIVVLESLELVKPLAAARQIRLHNEVVGPMAMLHLLADQQRLKQVLLNLLSNAVKYNGENGAVTVSCEVIEASEAETPREIATLNGPARAAGKVRFEVRDTGAGLSADDIAKLFVPFERLGAAHTQIEGTGIGLTLCKRLVEAMNGQIGVYSEVGAGSTFWVELPLSSSPVERAAQLETGGDSLETVCALADVGTILYIEDNLSNIALIQQVMQEQSYHVKLLTAMQGRVGLELATQHRPDLILLDVHLPDIMGDVVLGRLKANAATRDIPVVVLSADATPSQIERLMGGGAEAYLTKPLDLKRFFEVLEQVMGRV